MTVSDYKPVVGDLALPATSLSLYVPLGPQLQALWRDPHLAKEIQYLREETQQIYE